MERFTGTQRNLIVAIAMLMPYQNNECMKDHLQEVIELFETYREKLDEMLEEESK